MSQPQVNTMLVCFFDHKGIVHYELIAQGQMVNQQCYLEVLTRLWESVPRKRPALWPGKWILHHDSAPAHDALRVREFLPKNSITKMDHPPYSPDLAPCDFWLFPKLKNALKGQTFADLLTSNATWKHYCEVFRKMIFKTVSGSGTVVSRSAQLHKESFWTRQQPLVHRWANFTFTGPFRELNCRTPYIPLQVWTGP